MQHLVIKMIFQHVATIGPVAKQGEVPPRAPCACQFAAPYRVLANSRFLRRPLRSQRWPISFEKRFELTSN